MPKSSTITAYRPCVGIMLLNSQGLVWIGRRFEKANDDGVGAWWQMPQGGIDADEHAERAARRELQEETSVTQVEFLAEAPGWYSYDLPPDLIGVSWKGKYRGQKQKWFAYRFKGRDEDIDIAPQGAKPEFDRWRWAPIDEVAQLIVPFKRPVYEQVIAVFRHLAA